MEIVSLFGAMVSYDKGLSKVTRLLYSTLKELGVKVNEVNLSYNSVPYFDGIKSEIVEPITKSIRDADGIIIATTAFSSMYSSIIQTLFEHMTIEEYKDTFKQKNCLLLVVSNEDNSLAAMSNLAITLNNLGGYDSTRIVLDHKFIRDFTNNPPLSEIIERQVEDFYRIIRQKRHYYLPAKAIKISSAITSNMAGALPSNLVNSLPSNMLPSNMAQGVPQQPQRQAQRGAAGQPQQHNPSLVSAPPAQNPQRNQQMNPQQHQQINPQQHQQMNPQQMNLEQIHLQPNRQINQDLSNPQNNGMQVPKQSNMMHPESQYMNTIQMPTYNDVAIENFNNKQTEDIKEIAQFFSQKYQGISGGPPGPMQPREPLVNMSNNVSLEPLMPAMPEVTKPKNCRQLTASLVHYYQPQLASGLVATIQINISGSEEFNGYIQIDNIDCNYYDGIANNPTITIISSDRVWIDVLTGKATAQKSFMTGHLKIKGNFVLLTKFDQIFNTSKNLA